MNSVIYSGKLRAPHALLHAVLRVIWFFRAKAVVVSPLFLALGSLSFGNRHDQFRGAADPDQPEGINLFVIGDRGAGSRAQIAVARAMDILAQKQGKPDFVALQGDNLVYGRPFADR